MNTHVYRKKIDSNGTKTWRSLYTRHFRRHYWYRMAPGRYAGSVEGVRRMSEMIQGGLTVHR